MRRSYPYLDAYIAHSTMPLPREDGKCVLCCNNPGDLLFKHKLVPGPHGREYQQDHSYDICRECMDEISYYDTLHYG